VIYIFTVADAPIIVATMPASTQTARLMSVSVIMRIK
jgi:hypothetical protein